MAGKVHLICKCALWHVANRLIDAPSAPFDAIHVGAAAASIPAALLEQLAPGGRMVRQ